MGEGSEEVKYRPKDWWDEEGFRAYLKQSLLAIRPLHRFETDDDLNEDIEKEIYFVRTVFENLKDLAEKGKTEVIILFDIDDTLGKYDSSHGKVDGHWPFIIRPGFQKLVEELRKLAASKNLSLKAGFITNREAQFSSEQLEPTGQFGKYRDFFSKDLVFSSRGYSENTAYNDKARRIASVKNLPFINADSPELAEVYPGVTAAGITPDDFGKLVEIGKRFPKVKSNEALMVVDDMPRYTTWFLNTDEYRGLRMEKGYFNRVI